MQITFPSRDGGVLRHYMFCKTFFFNVIALYFWLKIYIMRVKEFTFDKVADLQLNDYFSKLLSTNEKQLPWGCHGQPWSRSKKLDVLHKTWDGIHFLVSLQVSLQLLTLVKNNYFSYFSRFQWITGIFQTPLDACFSLNNELLNKMQSPASQPTISCSKPTTE